MADTWNSIGMILGIVFVILLISSRQGADERQKSRRMNRYNNEENDLLDDLEELILIEDFEEELEDDGYFNHEE